MFKILLRICCLLSLLAMVSLAQNTNKVINKSTNGKPVNKESKNNTEKELTPIQQRAIYLLQSLTKEVTNIDDNLLKIKVKARIADTLWEREEKRARQLFQETFQSIDSLEVTENTNKNTQNSIRAILTSSQFQLRQELLSLVAVHDASFADELRKSTERRKDTKNISEQDIQKSRQEQTLQTLLIAKSLAKRNPQKAGQLVRESFQYGINPFLISVLIEMRVDNPELANVLFNESVDFAKMQPDSFLEKIGMLATYILPNELDIFYGRDISSAPEKVTAIKYFLGTVAQIISLKVNSENSNVSDNKNTVQEVIILQQLSPYYSQFMPDGLPAVKLRLAQLTKQLPQQEAESIENLPQKIDFQDILTEAEYATDPQTKDQLYVQAARQAVMQDQPDEAIRIADKIKNKQQNEIFSSVIRYQICLKLINSDKIDSAIRYSKEIKFLPQRIEIHNRIAQHLVQKKDFQRTTQVIHDFHDWLEKLPNNPQKVRGLLAIAATASSFDSLQGFDILRSAINAIDNVNNAEFTVRQKGIVNSYEIPVTLEMLDFTKSFGVLAHSDLERAILIAQSIKNKDASILAQIAICQSILSFSPIP